MFTGGRVYSPSDAKAWLREGTAERRLSTGIRSSSADILAGTLTVLNTLPVDLTLSVHTRCIISAKQRTYLPAHTDYHRPQCVRLPSAKESARGSALVWRLRTVQR